MKIWTIEHWIRRRNNLRAFVTRVEPVRIRTGIARSSKWESSSNRKLSNKKHDILSRTCWTAELRYVWHVLSESGAAALCLETRKRICGHSLFGIIPVNVAPHQFHRHLLKMWPHLICIYSILSLPSVQSAYSEECEVSVRPQSEVETNWNSEVQEQWIGLSDCKLKVYQMNGYESWNLY